MRDEFLGEGERKMPGFRDYRQNTHADWKVK